MRGSVEEGKSMSQNDQQFNVPELFVDPEPISIAIALYGAVVDTVGLIIHKKRNKI
jgi:hypothetical protein